MNLDELAHQAGEETGDCYPGDTPWRRRFAELVAAGARRESAEEILRIERERDVLRALLAYAVAEADGWHDESRGGRRWWMDVARDAAGTWKAKL